MNIYVIQNQEGKYFRNVGYGGGGTSWRDKLEDAKFYTKLGQARSRVTFWYKNYPEYGCPKIIAFVLGEENRIVMNMEKETELAIKRGKQRELKDKMNQLNYQLTDSLSSKQSLQRKIDIIKEEINKLK